MVGLGGSLHVPFVSSVGSAAPIGIRAAAALRSADDGVFTKCTWAENESNLVGRYYSNVRRRSRPLFMQKGTCHMRDCRSRRQTPRRFSRIPLFAKLSRVACPRVQTDGENSAMSAAFRPDSTVSNLELRGRA